MNITWKIRSITESLKSKKIYCVIVPGGCSKYYIQAVDVSWNKPFKSLCTEKYNEWLGTVGINEETAAGNLRALPRRAYNGFWTLGLSFQKKLSNVPSQAVP